MMMRIRSAQATDFSARQPATTSRTALVSMDSAQDGLAHLITDEQLADGMRNGLGVYRSLCGSSILAGSMSSAPGRPCRACRDHRRDPT